MIILASKSPNRKELLEKTGIPFTVEVSNVDESAITADTPEKLAQVLALSKAQAVATQHPDAIVIGADTVVEVDGEILGKPKDEDDAKRMLRLLSGKQHHVHSGFAVLKSGSTINDVDTTAVVFRTLTEDDIAKYVATKEPFGRAGSYAYQGLAGARFVTRIEGDPNTIIGLPLVKILQNIQEVATNP